MEQAPRRHPPPQSEMPQREEAAPHRQHQAGKQKEAPSSQGFHSASASPAQVNAALDCDRPQAVPGWFSV